MHLDPILILLIGDVALEDMKNVLFTGKLLPPHGPKLLGFPAALQIEKIVVSQLPKGRGGGVSPAAIGEVIPLLGAVDVALWPHGPEYGAHVLAVTLVVGGGLPREGLEGDRVLAPHPKTLQDLDHSHLPVQSVEMETLDLCIYVRTLQDNHSIPYVQS